MLPFSVAKIHMWYFIPVNSLLQVKHELECCFGVSHENAYFYIKNSRIKMIKLQADICILLNPFLRFIEEVQSRMSPNDWFKMVIFENLPHIIACLNTTWIVWNKDVLSSSYVEDGCVYVGRIFFELGNWLNFSKGKPCNYWMEAA